MPTGRNGCLTLVTKRKWANMIVGAVFVVTSVPVLISFLSGAHAVEWHVDASVTVSGDVTSPERGFKTIQDGIDAASDGMTRGRLWRVYYASRHDRVGSSAATIREHLIQQGR